MFVDNPLGTAGLSDFSAFRGRPVDVAVTYADRTAWSQLTNPWMIDQYSGFSGQLSIGVPLTISGTDLAAVAAGDHDDAFAGFANLLVSAGRADSIVRLGWEFNGNWYPWSAYDAAAYVAAFRHVVGVLRRYDPDVVIEWSGNLGVSQCANDPFTQLYPGDQYVDLVSLDAYDTKWARITSAKAFANWAASPYGLNAWYKFAVSHGKRFAVSEWGVIADSSTGGLGEGDNAVYVRSMHSWFAAHAARLDYEAYFNDPHDPTTANSLENPVLMPASADVYASLW